MTGGALGAESADRAGPAGRTLNLPRMPLSPNPTPEHSLPPGVSVRRRAIVALLAVEDGTAGSQIAVREALGTPPELAGPDRGLVTELVYATLRHQRVLDRWLAHACAHGLCGLDTEVLIALRVGACQLAYLPRVPAFAAVDATVEAAKGLVAGRAVGFVHGVLRGLARRRPEPGATLPQAGSPTSLPDWIALRSRRLAAICGLDADALHAAFDQPAPLHLHVPAGDAELVWAELAAAGVAVAELDGVAVPGVRCADGGGVFATSAFARRAVLAQDAASAAVVRWLAPAPGARTADVAAGAGVKALALAAAGARVTAIDLDGPKLADAAALARQAGHPLDATIAGDASTDLGLDREAWDAVLVDAPCSGLGTLRRRPEIRHRRRAADLPRHHALQARMLAAASDLVRPGGHLVYAVCSFAEEEGPLVVGRFLAAHPGFVRDPGGATWVRPLLDAAGDLRTHPLLAGMDAFYAARLQRSH